MSQSALIIMGYMSQSALIIMGICHRERTHYNGYMSQSALIIMGYMSHRVEQLTCMCLSGVGERISCKSGL